MYTTYQLHDSNFTAIIIVLFTMFMFGGLTFKYSIFDSLFSNNALLLVTNANSHPTLLFSILDTIATFVSNEY